MIKKDKKLERNIDLDFFSDKKSYRDLDFLKSRPKSAWENNKKGLSKVALVVKNALKN